MRTSYLLGALAALAIVGFLAWQSAFIVYEADQVVITQFGRPVGEPTTDPGLYFKTPLLQEVHRFDKRFIEWDGERNRIPTRDKRFIFVDSFARWRISDPLKFFQRLRGDERFAQSRLDDILDGETRNVIARHELIEAVRTSSREFAIDDEDSGGLSNEVADSSNRSDFTVKVGRAALATEVLEASQRRAAEADLGIEILDFQFKRINYVQDVQDEVYTRMISERQRIAEQFRSEGQGQAARISGEKERELARITSEAFREAEEIRGEADARAAEIYANAYNANRELYSFVRTMETFANTVDEDTVLLLDTQGEVMKYLDDANPR